MTQEQQERLEAQAREEVLNDLTQPQIMAVEGVMELVLDAYSNDILEITEQLAEAENEEG